MDMTPDQVREMDRLPFPPAIFHNNPNVSIPKNIGTWGQLKQLAATNGQLLGGMDMQRLQTFQKFHLAQLLKETSNRSLEQNGQTPWVPRNVQGPQQPFMNPQQFQSGQQPPQFPMPHMRQITAEELQMARHRLGSQVQNLSDEQLRDILRQRQMQAVKKQTAQALQNQQSQQAQAQLPPQASIPTTASHVNPENQAQNQAPQQTTQSQAAKVQSAMPAKPAKGPGPKQTPPTSKRKVPSEETSVAKTSPVQGSTQPAASQGLPAAVPSRPPMPFSREQLAAMTPQQRAQIELHIRRQQQGQTRGTINRAAAEDAWNNLPDKLRHLYNDIAKNAPPEQAIAVTPEQRATMNQQLRDCTDYLGRMDALVQFISKVPNQDKNVQSLLGMVSISF